MRTWVNSLAESGAFTLAVQFVGRSNGHVDSNALISSSPCNRDHKLHQRHVALAPPDRPTTDSARRSAAATAGDRRSELGNSGNVLGRRARIPQSGAKRATHSMRVC